MESKIKKYPLHDRYLSDGDIWKLNLGNQRCLRWKYQKNGKWYLMENRDQWREYGHFFGFPKCCIESFVNGNVSFNQTEEQRQALEIIGSVYLPCAECSKKIIKTKMRELDPDKYKYLQKLKRKDRQYYI